MLKHLRSKLDLAKHHQCNQCDYKATLKGDLLKHIQSKHEGVKFPCDQCDFKAKGKGQLLRHIKSKHEGVKFPCDQCD